MNLLFKDRKKREKESKLEREREFLKNGGILLELLVSLCDGRPPPIRNFSYEDLKRATNDFNPNHLLNDIERVDKWYRGSHEGRSISIKKYREPLWPDANWPEDPFKDIAIHAKVSAHKNILKLIGCCLDTPIPIVVTEFTASETLFDRISSPQGKHMAWQSRLKIAKEIAHAIAYLHTAFPRPIIHRNIRTFNIIFDQYDIPKLTNFTLSISLPEGETQVKDIVRGSGLICPKYLGTGWITEKVDVFNFGVLLLELSTGRHPFFTAPFANNVNILLLDDVKTEDLFIFVDPAILAEEGGAIMEQQLKVVLQLALKCVRDDPERRPTMVDVTKELRQIERFVVQIHI